MEPQAEKIAPYLYRIPPSYKPGMRVPGLIYADEELFEKAKNDRALEQVANTAFLPGIVKASMAMPDIHWGYGFPIGGVAATDASKGVISPGGVGFDINCGVRVVKTNLLAKETLPHVKDLMHELSRSVPKGVGSRGKIKVDRANMEELLLKGARWAVESGYGWPEDLDFIEEGGEFQGADPGKVSKRAFERGFAQTGTLGAGNHFLELQEVTEIFEPDVAEVFGLFRGQLLAMIHSGSRGVGHQICTDYLRVMDSAVRKWGIEIPDRQLACAPIDSPEAQDYIGAMAAGINFAFCNRQFLAHWVRQSFEYTLKKSSEDMEMRILYDHGHNLAKFEEHSVDGERRRLCVHRKGATRAFGPDNPLIPIAFRRVGQPVIIPGDMGTSSYILVGTAEGMDKTFGSTCHGAGRTMSRSAAKRQIRGDILKKELEAKGITVVAGHLPLLAEEAPQAYKDIAKVVDICDQAGLSRKVAKLRPLGVLKG